MIEDILNKPITVMELDTRSLHILRELNAHYLKDVVALTVIELLREPNCGRKTVRLIQSELERLNLSLADADNHSEYISATKVPPNVERAYMRQEYVVHMRERENLTFREAGVRLGISPSQARLLYLAYARRNRPEAKMYPKTRICLCTNGPHLVNFLHSRNISEECDPMKSIPYTDETVQETFDKLKGAKS